MNWYIWPMAIIFVISFLANKEKYHPVTIFSGFWFLLSFLSLMKLYDVPTASNDIYMYVMLGVCFFAVGSFVFSFINKRMRIAMGHQYATNKQKSTGIRYRFFNILSSLLIICLLMYLSRTLTYMLRGFPLNDIRSNFTTLVIQNNIERLLWTFFVLPATLGIVPICLYAYAVDKKGIKYIILSLFATMFLSVCDGGRVYLMFYVIQFAFFVLLNPSRERVKDKIRNKFLRYLYFVAIAVACVALMNFISSERQIEESTGESLYVYLTGCFPFMEYKINELVAQGSQANGLAFFYAPITLVLMILKNIGLINYPEAFLKVQEAINGLQDCIKIGSYNFNAFASLYWYFYYDFGVAGICIGSGLFGAICNSFYNKMKLTHSARYMIVYSIIIIAIASSMVRWQFGRPCFFMSLIYIYWATRTRAPGRRLAR